MAGHGRLTSATLRLGCIRRWLLVTFWKPALPVGIYISGFGFFSVAF